MIELTYQGVDMWDRLVFTGDNGKYYKTTQLMPGLGPEHNSGRGRNEIYDSLSTESKYDLLHSLHTTDSVIGEPDTPCWKEGEFTLKL
jgi:hypothetical protein